MKENTVHAFGMGLIIFAFFLFFFMVYALIAWGPKSLVIMAVVMGMFVGGGLLMSYGTSDETDYVPDAPEENPFVNEPKIRNGTGNGYCPGCGSPISEGDTFCGVCGRRF